MSKIGFLGLGAMGSRMAINLMKAGHDVTVWNRSAEAAASLVVAGAQVASNPRDAVAGVEFAFSMMREDAGSVAIWLDPGQGALAGLPAGAVGIESSTLTTGWTEKLAGHFQAAGRDSLDAPVAGSRPQAVAAQRSYLIGGDSAVLAKA